jgi:hypothetical protein
MALWMGGPPPPGYGMVDKMLAVNEGAQSATLWRLLSGHYHLRQKFPVERENTGPLQELWASRHACLLGGALVEVFP